MVPEAVREGRGATLNLPHAFQELVGAEPRLRLECLKAWRGSRWHLRCNDVVWRSQRGG
jgi:hypothetical protein